MEIAEEKLNKVAVMILDKTPESKGFSLEDIKYLVRTKANEIINNY